MCWASRGGLLGTGVAGLLQLREAHRSRAVVPVPHLCPLVGLRAACGGSELTSQPGPGKPCTAQPSEQGGRGVFQPFRAGVLPLPTAEAKGKKASVEGGGCSCSGLCAGVLCVRLFCSPSCFLVTSQVSGACCGQAGRAESCGPSVVDFTGASVLSLQRC